MTMSGFQVTLSGLTVGLTVGQIATRPIETCDINALASDVLKDRRFEGIDQIPVRDRGRIVGVLERSHDFPNEQVDRVMRPLDDSLLVSAAEPLPQFLLETFAGRYRLVIDGSKIDGIVTWSDIQKMPVRLLVFAMVSHLESLMMALIALKYPSPDGWMPVLSECRQEKLREEQHKRQDEGLDPPLLELTYFADKHKVVKKAFDLPKKFKSDMFRAEELRNTVAHARTYADSQESLRDFLTCLRKTNEWIRHLDALYRQHHTNGDPEVTNI